MSQLGIDISEFEGEVNFEALLGNVEFVIMRAGYASTIDPQFERNYNECQRLGIPCGAYYYSYALNEQEAIEEAENYLQWLANKRFSYPVYLDMEDADHYKEENGVTTSEQIVAISNAFLNHVEQQNYFVGIYSSLDWFHHQLDSPVLDRYSKWIADWGSNDGSIQVDVSDRAGMLQYTSRGRVPGYEGDIDRDIAYIDYPEIIIKGEFNGYHSSPIPATEYKVGDLVHFNRCYESSTSPASEALVPLVGYGTITRIYSNTNNPYLIDNGMCFVNDEAITGFYQPQAKTKYMVGDQVTFNSCYESSTSKIGWPPVGEALIPLINHGTITHIYVGTNNPYLINNGMCFVNDGDIQGAYITTYIVQSGDTLSEIAERFNTTYQRLAAINGISDANLIYPNQVLKV